MSACFDKLIRSSVALEDEAKAKAKAGDAKYLFAHLPIVVCDTPTLYVVAPEGGEPRPVGRFHMPFSVPIGASVRTRLVSFVTKAAFGDWVTLLKKEWFSFNNDGLESHWSRVQEIRNKEATAYANASQMISRGPHSHRRVL